MRPSVLFINRVYPPARGATGRMLQDLARMMVIEGWDVTVLTTGAEKATEKDKGVKVIRVKSVMRPRGILAYLKITKQLKRAAMKLPAPHLLVTMTDPPMLVTVGRAIQKRKKCRHIHWCQDLYPDLLPALGIRFPYFVMGYLKKRSAAAMKSCDKVIVIGRCMAKLLTKKDINPAQIAVIPNWPDIELVSPEGQEAFNHESALPDLDDSDSLTSTTNHRPPEEQHRDHPKFRILYAGHLGRAHPMATILRAAEAIKTDMPDVEFVFVGDGPEFDKISEFRKKRHLDNIRLMPYQPLNRLRFVMESGDVHLISMRGNAAGMLVPSKLYSASAVGRPALFLGPKNCEVAKVIQDFKSGSVVSQNDLKGFIEEIRKYRYDEHYWFNAHHAAVESSKVFVPKESMDAWVERAWAVIEDDIRSSHSE